MPTISIDKTDGCQMFLSKDSLGTEIITAKSSEMNVMIPDGDDFVSSHINSVRPNHLEPKFSKSKPEKSNENLT